MKRMGSSRSGLTLVELLLFMGLLAMGSGAVIGFMMLSSESRVRQEAASRADDNGLQLLQLLEHEIRQSERIIAPSAGGSGRVLVLQSSDPESDPIVIGAQSGAMLLVRRDVEHTVSPSEVTVSDFHAYNVSAAADRPGVRVVFTVSSIVPLPGIPPYVRTFESAVTVFPDDLTSGNSCGCPSPSCAHGFYQWRYCDASVCSAMSGSLLCP